MATGILCGLLLASCLCCCAAILCFQCDHVPDPGDCNQLVVCASNEQCISQKFVGFNSATYYSLGCGNTMMCQQNIPLGKRHTAPLIEAYNNAISRKFKNGDKHRLPQSVQLNTRKRSVGDKTVCSQCCNSADGCNGQLCGAVINDNLRCLSCKNVMDPKDCNAVEQCNSIQACYVHYGISSYSANYESRYELGCVSKLVCESIKHMYQQNCMVCCNTTFCNYRACDTWEQQHASITPGLETTQIPFHLPTRVLTTTKTQSAIAPRVLIHGPARDSANNGSTLPIGQP